MAFEIRESLHQAVQSMPVSSNNPTITVIDDAGKITKAAKGLADFKQATLPAGKGLIAQTDTSEAKIRALVDKLAETKDEDIESLVKVFVYIGKPAVPHLVSALKDKNKNIVHRVNVTLALGKMGPAAKNAVPTLIGVFKDKGEDANLRGSAAWPLGEMGAEAKDAVPVLTEALKENNMFICCAAGYALKNIYTALGEEDKVILPGLIGKLGYKGDRVAAIDALGNIGPAAKDAVPALINVLLKTEDKYIALDALKKIAPVGKESIAFFINALRDKDNKVREGAALALGYIGLASKEIISTLIDGLKDEEWKVRMAAARALGEIGHAAKEAIPALIVALKDYNACVRMAAEESLKKIRGEGK